MVGEKAISFLWHCSMELQQTSEARSKIKTCPPTHLPTDPHNHSPTFDERYCRQDFPGGGGVLREAGGERRFSDHLLEEVGLVEKDVDRSIPGASGKKKEKKAKKVFRYVSFRFVSVKRLIRDI